MADARISEAPMPRALDRLIVHQSDAARPSPGGIDTCIRGILRYASASQAIGLVGVDTGNGPAFRRLGRWEEHSVGNASVFFLPVARVDPADQRRRVPHSARLVAGLTRYRRRIPEVAEVQAHRADTAASVALLFRKPLYYFIHTQEAGLTGETSDSMWRRAGRAHRRLETWVSGRARSVAVFNPDYITVVKRWNPEAQFFPTWWDPAILAPRAARRAKSIVWVGRAEPPKDPVLAVEAVRALIAKDPEWTLDVIGSGTLLQELRTNNDLPGIRFHGRVAPEEVARIMAASDVFLMTSHPGYEGYPRVLVEAMASGLRPVVTAGSDTGSLLAEEGAGFVTTRDPREIAHAIQQSGTIDRAKVRARVAHLSAESVIRSIYGATK